LENFDIVVLSQQVLLPGLAVGFLIGAPVGLVASFIAFLRNRLKGG
jgi:hypothetical protein